jgi:hypothetical protein
MGTSNKRTEHQYDGRPLGAPREGLLAPSSADFLLRMSFREL